MSGEKKDVGELRDIQARRHTGTQTHRHTDTQTHRHTDTQTHRHTDTQTHRHTDTQTHKQQTLTRLESALVEEAPSCLALKDLGVIRGDE
jgi:Zn-finger nucleic acid-binding protein